MLTISRSMLLLVLTCGWIQGCMTITYSCSIKLVSFERSNKAVMQEGKFEKNSCYVFFPPDDNAFNDLVGASAPTLNNVKLLMRQYFVPYGVIKCPQIEAGRTE